MKNSNINYQITSVEEKELWPLEEVKNYLRVAHKNDDKLITSLITAAITSAEQFLGVTFFVSKITCFVDKAPDYFRAKYSPIRGITKVSVINGSEKEEITAGFGYVNYNHQKIYIAVKYLYKKLEIEYEAGLGEKIPRTILQGILMHVGRMYDFGENSINISPEIREMYLPYRTLKV